MAAPWRAVTGTLQYNRRRGVRRDGISALWLAPLGREGGTWRGRHTALAHLFVCSRERRPLLRQSKSCKSTSDEKRD